MNPFVLRALKGFPMGLDGPHNIAQRRPSVQCPLLGGQFQANQGYDD